MGEYARFMGDEVKIGTCEDMLYMRAEQAGQVTPLPGNVNPADPETQAVIRFRFPWPDEDGTEPGEYDKPDRGYTLREVRSPASVEHGKIQMRNDAGYLLMVPCPESCASGTIALASGTEAPYKIQYNGYPGPTELVQQAWRDGRLVSILKCRGCGTIWRLPTIEDAEPVIAELVARAAIEERTAELNDTPGNLQAARRLIETGRRIAAGYSMTREPVTV